MRKEIIWVAAIALFFGLVIAFGVWRINSSIRPSAVATESTPAPKTVSEFKITLNKPENEDVTTQSSVLVTGITKPLIWVVVSGEEEDYILQSNDKGVFEQEAELIAGVNQIKITAFDPQGNQSVEKVLVVYSSAFELKESQTESSAPGASTDSAVRQKVLQKVEAALNKPKAFIGTVTDITDSSIQIKSTSSEIRQISITSDTSAVDSKGTTSKTIKTTDIAIGDFIVAMGYVNTNSVLSAQRILVSLPIQEPKIEAKFGRLTAEPGKNISISSLKTSQEEPVAFDKNTIFRQYEVQKIKAIKIADLAEEDLVIYVLDSSAKTPAARSIFRVASPQT